jgi:Neocarzinostatin family
MKAKLRVAGLMLGLVVALAACSSNKATTPTTKAPGTSTTASTAAAPTTSTTAGQTITITPSTGLTNNEMVQITGTGYKPNEQLGVTECANKGAQTGAGDCNLGGIKVTYANAAGAVSYKFAVALGPFGMNNIVCTNSPGCIVSVAQAGVASPAQVATAKISFS